MYNMIQKQVKTFVLNQYASFEEHSNITKMHMHAD